MRRRATICRHRAKQRHTAQEQPSGEARVYYRYDPRAGTAVTVIGHTKVGEDNFLIVLQTDGTRAHIPQWMLLPEAANLTVHVPPRISLQGLQTLYGELNAVLSNC